MARKSAPEWCPSCKDHYDQFKTGLTYREVWQQFWVDSEDRTKWKNKRRRSVLGRWMEIKQDLWKTHIEYCYMEPPPF